MSSDTATKTRNRDVPPGWEGLLDDGEEILWQGQPGTRFSLSGVQPMSVLMGCFFVGFSIYWMRTAAGFGGPFWMFGLLFFGIGLWNAAGVHLWRVALRARTFYTLTNRRAYVATNIAGHKTLNSFAINKLTPLQFDGGAPATIWFGHKGRVGRSLTALPAAFEGISDGREVYAMMRQIQERAT